MSFRIKKAIWNIEDKINSFIGLKPRYLTPNQIRIFAKLKTYKVPLNKFVLSLAIIGIIACLITPATNWMIPLILKKSLEHI